MATVTITASNPNDIFPRDWNVFTTDPSGKYVGGGQWEGGITPIRYDVFYQPHTWTIDLPDGTYYFIIGQSGGSAYGTYSGTINGTPFSGVDINRAEPFTIGIITPPPSNGGTPTTPITTWIALGAISIGGIGLLLYFATRKRKKK